MASIAADAPAPGALCVGEGVLPDEAATARLGAALAPAIGVGDAILLHGDLGAGKTALARALIAARLDAPEDIPSPTFTLVQTYQADIEIWHVDLYRLSDLDEAYELGLDEAFDAAAVLVEWPERLGALLPARRLDIRLSPYPEGGRSVRWSAVGSGWDAALTALRKTGEGGA